MAYDYGKLINLIFNAHETATKLTLNSSLNLPSKEQIDCLVDDSGTSAWSAWRTSYISCTLGCFETDLC